MKRLVWLGSAVLVLTATVAVAALQRDGFDRWRAAAGGHATTRLAAFDLADGRYEFRAFVDEDGTPNVVYFTPGRGGGSRLVAVGEQGGWAVEPRIIHATDRDIVYGATIMDATVVEVLAGHVAKRADTLHVVNGEFRYFVLITDPGIRIERTHDITALDRDGNLLGRAHDNYGTGNTPNFGAYDGLWDREHAPPWLTNGDR